jgi:hypothetical protein
MRSSVCLDERQPDGARKGDHDVAMDGAVDLPADLFL